VDVGLDGRRVDPELAAARHLQRPGELDHPVVQRPDRLGPDGVAQRISVVSSGAFSRYTRQNWRSTRLSLTKYPAYS
jgi:hypothetical protein